MSSSCCCTGVCVSCATSQTLGSTSLNTCAGTRNVNVSSYTTPALNGLCMSVCGKITAAGTTCGVIIGGGPFLFGRNIFNNYGQQTKNLATGCPDGTSVFTSFGTFAVNDIITLRVEDTSSGAGTYKALSYVNGTLVNTTTGLAYTFTAGAGINIGWATTGGGTCILQAIATS